MWIMNSFKKLITKLDLKKININNEYLEDFNIDETFIDDNNLEGTLLDYVYNELIDPKDLYLKNNKEIKKKNYFYENLKHKEIAIDSNNVRIDDLFNNNKYNMFKSFCKKKNIKYIEDITEAIIIEFCNKPGAGVKKINDLKELLNKIYLKHMNLKYNIYSVNFIFCENEFEYLRDFCKKNKINHIKEFNKCILNKFIEEGKVSKKLIFIINERIHINNEKIISNKKYDEKIFLKAYWYNILKDFQIDFIINKLGLNTHGISYKVEYLQNKTINDLNKDEYIYILKFIDILNDIKSPEEIIKNINNILHDEREKRIFFKRYNDNNTLEEIGIEENLTRERVRQILKKLDDALINFLNINKFNISLQLKYINKDMCSLKDLYEIFGEDKFFYINSLIKMNNIGLSFVESLNLIVFKSENKLDDKIKSVINFLPENFKLCNYVDSLIYKLGELEIKDVTIEQIKDLLFSYGFNIYGEYCFKNKITIIKACELIFKKYLIKPLRIDDTGINIIRNLVYDHLNIILEGNDRAIESRIRDIESVLLVDKLTFMHINHINIEKSTIFYLKNLLKEAFKERDVVNASYLFENNKEMLIKNNIDNKYILYSLINYYYKDNYSVGKGNTLDIYKDKDIEYSRENMLKDIIKENNNMISKEDSIKFTGWSNFKIEEVISKSDSIIKLGNKITTLNYLKIKENEKAEISLILNKLMKKEGFTTSYLILKKLKMNSNLNVFLKRLNIDSNEKIAALIKKMFSNIKGHTQFLYNETCEYNSFEEVITKKYRNIFTKEDIKNYIYEYGYKDMMASTLINNNIDNNIFLEISSTELINSNDFELKEEIKNFVVKYIQNIFENEDYINLSNLTEDYKNDLPKIEYNWNIYLIRSILLNKGYRKINRTYTDTRYEKLILVKNNSKIKTFDELLYNILKNNYTGKMNEFDIYDYFSKLGLVYKHEDKFDKKIPFDLKNSGKIKIDNMGKVYLIN